MIKKSWTINTGITTGWRNWTRGQNSSFREEANLLFKDINLLLSKGGGLNEITDLKKLSGFIKEISDCRNNFVDRYNILADKSEDLNLSDMAKLRDELDNALKEVDSLEGKAGEKCNELIKKKFEEMFKEYEKGEEIKSTSKADEVLKLIDSALENMKDITTMANSLNFSENVKKNFQSEYDEIYGEFSQKLNEIKIKAEKKRKELEEKLKASEQMKEERIASRLKVLKKYENFKVDGKNYNKLEEALNELKSAINSIQDIQQDIFLEDDDNLASYYNSEIEESFLDKCSSVMTTIEATIEGLNSRKKACIDNLKGLLDNCKFLLNSCKETLKENKIRNIRHRINNIKNESDKYQNKLGEYQKEAESIGLNNDNDYKAKNDEIVQVLKEIIKLKGQLEDKSDQFKSALKTEHDKIVKEFKKLKSNEKIKTVSSGNLKHCEGFCKSFKKSLDGYIESLKAFYYSEKIPEKVETNTLDDKQLKADYLKNDNFQDEFKFVMTMKNYSEDILSNYKTECSATERKIDKEVEKIKEKLNEQIKTYKEKLIALQENKNVDPSSVPEKVNYKDVISLAKSYYGEGNKEFENIRKILENKNEQIIKLMENIGSEVDKKLQSEGTSILKELENCIKNKYFENKEEYKTNNRHNCLDKAEEYVKNYEGTESLESIVNDIKNKINEYQTKCEEFKKQKLKKEKNNQKEIKTEEPKKEQEHKSQEEKPAKIEKNEQKSSEDSEIGTSKGHVLADLLSEDDESSNKPENKPNDKPEDKSSNEPDYIEEFLEKFEQTLSHLSEAENKIKAKVLSIEFGRFIKEYEKINDKTLKEALKDAEETFEQNEKALQLYFENIKFIENNKTILKGLPHLIEQRDKLIKNIDLNSMKELLKAIDYAIEIRFIPKDKLGNWQMGSEELNKAIEDIEKLRKNEIK